MLIKYNLIFLLLSTLFCCNKADKSAQKGIVTIKVPLNTSQKLSEFVKKVEHIMLPKDFEPRKIQNILTF